MQNKVLFASRPFKMGAFNFILSLIFRYAWIWLLSLSLLGVAGLVLGITLDLRWFVVGLMMVFLILPMIFAFLYYYYGLKRECYINTVSHVLEIGEEGITVSMKFNDCNENEGISEYERKEFFPYDLMKPFEVGSKSVTIPFIGKRNGFIWIPADAFENEDILSSALKHLDNRLK